MRWDGEMAEVAALVTVFGIMIVALLFALLVLIVQSPIVGVIVVGVVVTWLVVYRVMLVMASVSEDDD